MDYREKEKLNTEELDQVAGGNMIDDAIDTLKKGVEVVKTSTETVMQAGEAVLEKAKEKIGDLLGTSKSPVQKHQDDSYRFGD